MFVKIFGETGFEWLNLNHIDLIFAHRCTDDKFVVRFHISGRPRDFYFANHDIFATEEEAQEYIENLLKPVKSVCY